MFESACRYGVDYILAFSTIFSDERDLFNIKRLFVSTIVYPLHLVLQPAIIFTTTLMKCSNVQLHIDELLLICAHYDPNEMEKNVRKKLERTYDGTFDLILFLPSFSFLFIFKFKHQKENEQQVYTESFMQSERLKSVKKFREHRTNHFLHYFSFGLKFAEM